MSFEMTTATWLVTICVVPASAFAAAVFTNHFQGKKAEEIKADLTSRINKVEAELTIQTNAIKTTVTQLGVDFHKVDKAAGELTVLIGSATKQLERFEQNAGHLTSQMGDLKTSLVEQLGDVKLANARESGAITTSIATFQTSLENLRASVEALANASRPGRAAGA